MVKHLQQQNKLLFNGNLKENVRKFKQQFHIYITAAGIKAKPEDIICHRTESSWNFQRTETGDNLRDDKKEKVLAKYENYRSPKSNLTYERHQFNIRNQREGESIDSYVTELRILSKSCEFGDLTDSLIKDRLVCGVEQKGSKRGHCA